MTEKTLYMVAVDGSDNSNRALDTAIDLAKKTDADLLIAHVINWSGFRPASALDMTDRPVSKDEEKTFVEDEILKPALEKTKKAGLKAKTYLSWGNPVQGLRKQAEKKGASVIFLGRSGHGKIAEMVLGSVSNALVHHAEIPVVLVP